VGLTEFERRGITAGLHAQPALPPWHEETRPVQADVVVADGDDRRVVGQLRRLGLLARTIAIAALPPAGVRLHLARPLDTVRLVAALVSWPVASAGVAPPAHAGPAVSPGRETQRVLRELARTSRQALDHILVVDRDEQTLRFMAASLQRFGFRMHLSRDLATAHERLARRPFALVFVDAGLLGDDAVGAWAALRASAVPPHDGGASPTWVALVDGPATRPDGADAVLARPLDELSLHRIVGEREVEQHAFARTALATTTLL
jgi:CheY-like chemotaxis protein